MSIDKKSTLTWNDCIVLTRKMNELQEAVTTYAAHGCKKEGLQNDFFVFVTMHDLKNKLDALIEARK